MAIPHERAREDLQEWQALQPENFYTSNRQMGRLLRRLMPADRLADGADHLARFGAVVGGPLDRAAEINNRHWNLPRLDRWSPIGERIEAIEHHPTFQDCGRHIYEDGRVIAAYGDSPANLHAQALFYLSSHAGEAGHNCPVACTAGVVKALQGAGSDALRERWLPGLLTDRWPDRLDGAQFLTELQGGSDVGSNAVEARPDGEEMGTTRWRIHGEKWFCSNADADLILMTARVEGGAGGTRGLGLFLVPRLLEDGSVNHFRLRRLKDKLGTRSMPSGEIDFDGAVAYAVGDVSDGFRHVMTYVINTSRLYNTVGCAGISRRAHLIADAYARRRKAFGSRIFDYPMVQEMLASTRATSDALLAGSLELAAMADRGEAGALDESGRAFLRVATNLAKMRSCQHSHRVVLTGIETLGGNGAIESFSILPRLLRDNVVYENWEGTHNTLVAQTVRDFARLRLHEGFLSGLRGMLDVDDAAIAGALRPAVEAVDRAEAAIEEMAQVAADDPGVAGLMLKPHAEALADAFFSAAYARDVATEDDAGRRAAEIEALAFYAARELAPTRPVHDRKYAEQVRTVASITE
ncbi:MAG: acyl-CoA dehydrogenase family protein [Myxococcota bacterium]